MADDKPTTAFLCGQLYATLNTLCAIGTREQRPGSAYQYGRARKEPAGRLNVFLAEAARYLIRARRRGPQHAKAADELFRAIIDHMPADGRLPAYFHNGGHDEFDAGFRTQMDTYTAAHAPLMK
jgi:hypothetical protein